MKTIYTTLLGLTIGLGTSYAQTTVTLTPSQDNCIYADNVNGSNGRGNIFAGTTCGNKTRRALIQFDLSSIPSGATITDVSLAISVENVSGNAMLTADDYRLHRVTTEWGEGTSSSTSGSPATAVAPDATWNDAMVGTSSWNNVGGDFISVASSTTTFAAATGVQTFSSTNILIEDVQDWLDGITSNFGWILIGTESSNCSSRKLGSKEQNTAPRLTITYDVASNIEDIAPIDEVKVYPNPSTGLVNIDLGDLSDVSIQVFNSVGQLVDANQNINEQVYTMKLPQNTGLYMIKVNANDEERYYNVIRE